MSEEKEVKTVQPEREKNRIDLLIDEIEKVNKNVNKHFSFKSYFLKGLWQGLGIVIGSTILAGVLYSATTKIVDKDVIRSWTLKYLIEENNLNSCNQNYSTIKNR